MSAIMAKRCWARLLFVFYLLILLRITVFRTGWLTNERFEGTLVLIPFQSVSSHLLRGNVLYLIYLFVGNLIWFVPLGAYLRWCGVRFWFAALCGFLLSLCIETWQFILSTGFSDTEDLILNTVGTMLGYGGMTIMQNRKTAKSEAANAIASLTAAGKTLATAESCTGGLLGKLLTDVPGASKVYLGGVISYAYEAKESLLGVPHKLLAQKGAVCPEVAVEMAQGVRERLDSDYGIGITGNAGPSADPNNPNVGEIYVTLATRTGYHTEKLTLHGSREKNREDACLQALKMLLKAQM